MCIPPGRCGLRPLRVVFGYPVGADVPVRPWEVTYSPWFSVKSVFSAGGQSRPPLRRMCLQKLHHLRLIAVRAVFEQKCLWDAAHLGKAELSVKIDGALVVGKHAELHLRKSVFLRLLQRTGNQNRTEAEAPGFFLDGNAELRTDVWYKKRYCHAGWWRNNYFC